MKKLSKLLIYLFLSFSFVLMSITQTKAHESWREIATQNDLIFEEENLQEDDEPPYIPPSDEAVAAKLQEWQDWKFGVIIHWGPYSQWGIVESWSLCPEDEPWCERRGPYGDDYCTYVREYEKIRHVFNPVKFDPARWAKACSDAGMKYVVFTAKHHDGFCMFDTKTTDYKITAPESIFSSHPKSNIVKEVFDAFRNEGLGIGAYFSKADWHSDDYWWPYFPVFDRNVNYDHEKYPERWKRFQEFTFNQIEELMTGYGSVDILWLDGGWVRPAGTLTEETRPWLGKNQWVQDIDMPAIAGMARHHQPGLLIVDRTVHDEYENYRTPEQHVPDNILPHPWESCFTLGDSWYSTGPGERYKSARWAIHTLINIVAKGGNLLLGIGPDKTGELTPEVYHRLEEIGNWMDVNSGAIYNTKPIAPYNFGNYCFTQSNDERTRYLFYLIEEGKPIPDKIDIPDAFAEKSNQAGLLGHPSALEISGDKGNYTIDIPGDFKHKFEGTPALVFYINNYKRMINP
jgi:alpha-L-fucosidase